MTNKSNLVRYLEDQLKNEPTFESLSPRSNIAGTVTGSVPGDAAAALGLIFAALVGYDWLKSKLCPEKYLADKQRYTADFERDYKKYVLNNSKRLMGRRG